MTTIQTVLQGVITLGILAGYIVLTSLGHDGTALLGMLGGQGAGIGAILVGQKKA